MTTPSLLLAQATPGAADLGGTGENVLFWVIALITVPGALGLLFARKAVHAALCMALVMVCLGIAYLALQAPFLGVVQIFVYAGAVMMLFLFMMMLVGVDSSDSLVETIKGQRWLAFVFGLALAVLMTSVIGQATYGGARGLQDVDTAGNMTGMAELIFGKYVWAFEATSALLITAVLGAMMLAHRERLTPKATQKDLAIKRIQEGPIKAPLPSPGVFARHNAVDIPALLPDGTPSELSVSRVLTARGQNRSVLTVSEDVTIIEAEISPAAQNLADPQGHGLKGARDRAVDGESVADDVKVKGAGQ
ncbi:NADH-quinone oxidoreductase subunit J [Kineosporia rhizophila]|uniref:NADH-quinone oxidoreductase subunit J n=1 Tax=Kineosporia TaxID=49184 RepID=UPI001E523954|nr:NADH-quinone oxidoreductase subunit J [Kineosporia sp. NBRC 101677]MCE0540544.1 NADH-quinone oxidoreductase subunit J [Kineosporia rhizophila]GLY13276.1 NADH:ubiquinone oxidoreductase subunit J [Kineosporia sp. NBRC 101677]